MSKFLFEIGTKLSGQPFKNKFVVVYENKTFVYCKVNGTDELLKVRKDIIGVVKPGYYSSAASTLYTYENESITDTTKEYETKMMWKEREQLLRGIESQKRQLDYMTNRVSDLTTLLEKKQES